MTTYDTLIIGSGFGGSMAAHTLVHAGQRVLMLERGGWVRRGPDNWQGDQVGLLSEHYATESPYVVVNFFAMTLTSSERMRSGTVQPSRLYSAMHCSANPL